MTPDDVYLLLASVKALIVWMLVLQVIDILATTFQIIAKIVIFTKVIRLLRGISSRDAKLGQLATVLEKQAELTDRRSASVEESVGKLAEVKPILPEVAMQVSEAKAIAADTNSKVTDIQRRVTNGGTHEPLS
jgi:methyl-accepting chemotaxis protein